MKHRIVIIDFAEWRGSTSLLRRRFKPILDFYRASHGTNLPHDGFVIVDLDTPPRGVFQDEPDQEQLLVGFRDLLAKTRRAGVPDDDVLLRAHCDPVLRQKLDDLHAEFKATGRSQTLAKDD